MIYINDNLSIPEGELTFTAVRSPGPGGQHVNKTSTAVVLRFDLASSPSLTQLEKVILKGKLRRRISGKGILQLVSHSTRSQAENKRRAVERFAKLLAEALEPVMQRINTRVPRSSRRRRLEGKKRRSAAKRMRIRPGIDEE